VNLPRLIRTEGLLGEIVSGHSIGASPGAAANVPERTDTALPLEKVGATKLDEYAMRAVDIRQ
jgi:hypothetical protein